MSRRRYREPGSTTRDGYGYAHRRARELVLADAPPCWVCGAPATQADHVPPLDATALVLDLTRVEAAELYTVDGSGPYRILPACARCNAEAGMRYALAKRGAPRARRARRLNTSRQW